MTIYRMFAKYKIILSWPYTLILVASVEKPKKEILPYDFLNSKMKKTESKSNGKK